MLIFGLKNKSAKHVEKQVACSMPSPNQKKKQKEMESHCSPRGMHWIMSNKIISLYQGTLILAA
jgi:hypothetical protein